MVLSGLVIWGYGCVVFSEMFLVMLLSMLLFNKFCRLMGVCDGLVMLVFLVINVCLVYLMSKCIIFVLLFLRCCILLYNVKIMSDVIFWVGVGKLKILFLLVFIDSGVICLVLYLWKFLRWIGDFVVVKFVVNFFVNLFL